MGPNCPSHVVVSGRVPVTTLGGPGPWAYKVVTDEPGGNSDWRVSFLKLYSEFSSCGQEGIPWGESLRWSHTCRRLGAAPAVLLCLPVPSCACMVLLLEEHCTSIAGSPSALLIGLLGSSLPLPQLVEVALDFYFLSSVAHEVMWPGTGLLNSRPSWHRI